MTSKVKPGDTILVIKSEHRKREHIRQTNLWKTFKVFKIDNSYSSTEKKVFFIRKNNSQSSVWYLYLYNDEFVIVEPSTVTPILGDKIIVSSSDIHLMPDSIVELLGNIYTIIKFEQILGITQTWIEDEKGHRSWFLIKHYQILKRANAPTPTSSSCFDCHGTGQIQLFTSIQKCRCQDE